MDVSEGNGVFVGGAVAVASAAGSTVVDVSLSSAGDAQAETNSTARIHQTPLIQSGRVLNQPAALKKRTDRSS